MQKKLSICLVTMNRATQLKDALESCLKCVLPYETEFVIIDNASTDNTREVVKEIMGSCGYSYNYKLKTSNIGAGAGRNECFDAAKGEYVFGMDDDAKIDTNRNTNFFIKAIEILDSNPTIVSLTTQIYDSMLKYNRQIACGKEIIPGVYKCKMLSGGSHFLRKSFFKAAPYLANKYGYEELPPSLKAMDCGMLNVFCPDLHAIHNPQFNRWDYKDEVNYDLLISECAIPYSIKKMMYPKILDPILWLAFKQRCRMHLPKTKETKKKTKAVVKDTISNYKIDYKMHLKTIISMYRDFGASIF